MAKLSRAEQVELGTLKTQKESSDMLGPLTPKQKQRIQDLENKKEGGIEGAKPKSNYIRKKTLGEKVNKLLKNKVYGESDLLK